MATPDDPFVLVDWRRRVAELYAGVRGTAATDPQAAALEFRRGREALLREHPDSPIPPPRRAAWAGCRWYAYDPAWRIVARIERNVSATPFEIELAADGILRCVPVATAQFVAAGRSARLDFYWLEGYGGGLWLPFADASSGGATYGGGRYLYDTIKGADLGGSAEAFVLDFNFAYNPSCAYDARWSCPLAPPENRLPFAFAAGERM